MKSIVTSALCRSPTAATMRRSPSTICDWDSGRVVRTVPSSTASSAITLWALPARTDPTVITEG